MKKRIVGLGMLALLMATLALGGCFLFNREPVASFSWSPILPFAATNVSFDGSSSYDEDGSIASYSWDFGDGRTSSGVTVIHAFPDDGNYSVTLTVTDDRGAVGCETKTITVFNPAPSIGALTVKDIDTPSCCHNYICDRISATLSNVVDPASVSVSPKSVVLTTIDWGDGTISSGTSAIHRYYLPGLYTVTGKAVDDDGAVATKTATIRIEGLVPPVVRLSPSPSSVSLGATILFRLEAYDPDGWCNCCSCAPPPCSPPPCHSCDTVQSATFDEKVFHQLSVGASSDNSAENSPSGISIDPNCSYGQGNGIVRYLASVENPNGDVVVYEQQQEFSVEFDIPGTWIIKGIVWDDDCDCHRSASCRHQIYVPDPCCPDPS
ncbi:PKD domain-containing protein [Patescibacteria group bacterium]|nr:PKD domain-containing protein [Patescibacteria group bacterium]